MPEDGHDLGLAQQLSRQEEEGAFAGDAAPANLVSGANPAEAPTRSDLAVGIRDDKGR